MRTKEHAHDYRYFPEPDLMPFEPTEKWLAEVKSRVVELPLAYKQRLRNYGLAEYGAEVFKNNQLAGDYFEKLAKKAKNTDLNTVANLIINELRLMINLANIAIRNDPMLTQTSLNLLHLII